MTRGMIANLVVAAGAIAALLLAPNAKADPTAFMHDAAMVCRWLDVDASPASFQAMFMDMAAEGLDQQTAIDTVTYAMLYTCPEYADDLLYANDVING